jgi:voltage-gated potassium channel
MDKTTKSREAIVSHREEILRRLERITELPLLILSFVMIHLLVGPLLLELSPQEETTFLIVDYFIWALFAVDLVIKLVIVPQKRSYLRRHWLEVVVVVVPFFRPLRIIRIFVYGSRAWVVCAAC